MKILSKVFPAKLLLFGEYAILKGGDALAMPFHRVGGYLQTGEGQNNISKNYFKYLKKQKLRNRIDFARLEADAASGLLFQSSIPKGAGLGSSGALCSAIYSTYAQMTCHDLDVIKNDLSIMEGFFHGKSSGIDPLVSFCQTPILIKQTGIQKVEFRSDWYSRFYLIDSGIDRKTQGLVQLFLDKFDCDLTDEYLNLSNRCIESFLEAPSERDFFSDLQKVSLFQRKHMLEMIPEGIRQIWDQGIKDGNFALKICGAGGGGFFLVVDLRKSGPAFKNCFRPALPVLPVTSP